MEKCSKAGAARGATEVKETTVTAMSGRKRATEDPPVCTHDDDTEGKYYVGGIGPEERSDKSVNWTGEDTEESVK